MQNSKEFLSRLKNKRVLSLLCILLLIVVVPMIAFIAQRQQELRRHAAESPAYTIDAKRVADLQTIALYLKHYYKDHGSYPSHSNATTADSTLAQPWIPELQNYVFFLPVDPKNVYGAVQTTTFVYQYQSKQCSITTHSCSNTDTQHFVLGAHLKDQHNPNINWNFADFWDGWFVNYIVTDTTPIPPNITIPPTPPPLPQPTCFATGATRNPNGTSNFSWLHVAGGNIVDEHNCTVILQGFNTAGLEFFDALGGGITAHHIAQMSQNYNMNIWRIPLNVSWWNNNNFVPYAQMNYRDWIKQVIGWMRANGNYVEIDPATDVTIPPGGGNIPYCISEGSNPPPNPNCLTSQATLNNPPWTEQQTVAAITQFWQSIVPVYKSDPAILYDALNEPSLLEFPHYHNDLNQMITLIQHLNPKALVFVFGIGIQDIVNGLAPDYPQQNLVYPFHIYDDVTPYTWQDKIQTTQLYFTWMQQHNRAVSIEEWGDSNLPNKKSFADAIISLVKTHYVAETYYAYSYNAFFDSTGQVTPLGLLLQQEYGGVPTAQPVPAYQPSHTVITHDADSSTLASSTSFSWTHTTGNQKNRLLLVGVSTADQPGVASVTYNGVHLTRASAQNCATQCRVELWYLTNPAPGTNTITVTLSANDFIIAAGATTFYNVDQRRPLGTPATTTALGDTTIVVSVPSNPNQMIVDAGAARASVVTVTHGAGQTQTWNTPSDLIYGFGSYQAGAAGSTTMSWTFSQNQYLGQIAVPINPATVSTAP